MSPGASGDCSVGAPFGSVQVGIDAAMPGDVVLVADGSYSESLVTARPGEPARRITVRASGRGATLTSSGRVLSVEHPHITFESLVFDGWYGDRDAVRLLDNTVYDSEIAFRLRGPGSNGGAWVRVSNAVVYDVDTAVRYEDNIENMRLWSSTFGDDVGRSFHQAGVDQAHALDVRNLLLLGATLPAEAAHSSNLAQDQTGFGDVTRHNYHLTQGSGARGNGVHIAEVTVDRDSRPRSASEPDIGAFAYTAVQPQPDAGASDGARADVRGSADGSASSPDRSGGDARSADNSAALRDAQSADAAPAAVVSACGCSGHSAAARVLWPLLVIVALRRRRRQ